MIYYIIYTMLTSSSYLCAKFVYKGTDLQPAALLFLRSLWALILMVPVYNCGLKKAVWDGI